MEEDNKERLLQAAIQLFAEQSFDAVSIRQIASTAQVNSAMISYYFGSKQKLFEAAIAAQTNALGDLLAPATAALEPRAVLRLYATTLQKIHQHNPTLLKFICREFVAPSDAFDTFIRQRLQQVFRLLASALQRGIDSGLFRPDLEIGPTVILWAGMVNFYYLSRSLSERIAPGIADCSETRYLENACRLFFAGIERRPTP